MRNAILLLPINDTAGVMIVICNLEIVRYNNKINLDKLTGNKHSRIIIDKELTIKFV